MYWWYICSYAKLFNCAGIFCIVVGWWMFLQNSSSHAKRFRNFKSQVHFQLEDWAAIFQNTFFLHKVFNTRPKYLRPFNCIFLTRSYICLSTIHTCIKPWINIYILKLAINYWYRTIVFASTIICGLKGACRVFNSTHCYTGWFVTTESHF